MIFPATIVCVTAVAARKLSASDWSGAIVASMVHVPDDANVTTPSDSVHTDGDPAVIVKATSRPDVAVAAGVYVVPATTSAGTDDVNAIDCGAGEIAIVFSAEKPDVSPVACTTQFPTPVATTSEASLFTAHGPDSWLRVTAPPDGSDTTNDSVSPNRIDVGEEKLGGPARYATATSPGATPGAVVDTVSAVAKALSPVLLAALPLNT